jgi:hypothetical protein
VPSAQSTAPPGDNSDGDGSSDGDGDPPHPAPAKARKGKAPKAKKGKARRFRATVAPRIWCEWVAALDVVAAIPGAIFATLTSKTNPTDAERKLATVSAESAEPFSAFKARLAREARAHYNVGYAARIATRADNQAFYPHLHAVIVGLPVQRLRTLAEAAGLVLAYAETLQSPEAAARYIASRHQARHWDAVTGTRPFFARLPKSLPADAAPDVPDAAPQDALASDFVSSRYIEPQAALERIAANPPTGPIRIPGGTIADPAKFITATLADFGHRSPTVRAAAESNALALLRALRGGGP